MTMLSIGVLAGSLFAVATPTSVYAPHVSQSPSGARSAAPTDRATRQQTLNGRGQIWRSMVPASTRNAGSHAPITVLGR